MARIKVIATHFVDAPDWEAAETMVEQGQIAPDQITSEPATAIARDIVMFGLAKKFSSDHRRIFFDAHAEENYIKNLEELKHRTQIWLDGILEEIIKGNESTWE